MNKSMTKIEHLVDLFPDLKIKHFYMESFKHCAFVYGHTVHMNDYVPATKQYECLAEEVSHYKYTVGNIIKQETIDDRKQEHLARARAMEWTVSLDGLIECFIDEQWAPDEIAEYFGVDEDYLTTALVHYREKYGVIFRHGDYLFDLRQCVNITKIK